MNKKEIEGLFKESRTEMRQLFGVFEERMDDKFKLVTERFDAIDRTLDTHTELFKDIYTKLDKKADVDEFDSLDRRVTKLESKTARPSRSG